MLISPFILVRLLTVEDFGRYREFLLYTTLLVSLAAFGINSSLLRFVAHRSQYAWVFVNQALLMTAASSALVIGGVAALDFALGGALVGEFMLPVGLYVALFVSFDFWEHLWIAQRRTAAVFAYTTGRLAARMATVIIAAALSGDIDVIIWSLVGLESIRMLVSASVWARHQESRPGAPPGVWREQLQFCLPFGVALALITLNRSMGSLFIAKMIGPVGLAYYAIGTYAQPVITIVRNSLSDALLPEMSTQQDAHGAGSLVLWKRVTVATAILLIAPAVILARFADTLVTTLFGAEYQPAVIVFQLYLLVLFREILDFGVPLRAINRTAPIMRSNLLSLVCNAVLIMALLPAAGLAGVAMAYVLSRTIEGAYLGRQMARVFGVSLREVARWADLGKVAFAAALAAAALYPSFWTESFGLPGAAAGAVCYLAVFAALLLLLRVPEALLMMNRLQQLPRAFMTRI